MPIYLDDANGNDANGGTKDQPVKTMGRAMVLAAGDSDPVLMVGNENNMFERHELSDDPEYRRVYAEQHRVEGDPEQTQSASSDDDSEASDTTESDDATDTADGSDESAADQDTPADDTADQAGDDPAPQAPANENSDGAAPAKSEDDKTFEAMGYTTPEADS